MKDKMMGYRKTNVPLYVTISLFLVGLMGTQACSNEETASPATPPVVASEPEPEDTRQEEASQTSTVPDPQSAQTEQPAPSINGKRLYAQNCLACHQANGSGVPNIQPPLTGSALLAGPKEPLIKFLLTAKRETPSDIDWLGVMTSFAYLSDDRLAAILTYSREAFVEADPITAEEVAKVRADLN